MTRGGQREGAGRKPGAANRRTREIADKALVAGLTPLEYLLALVRDETQPQSVRLDAAKAAAPYMHPRLSAVNMTATVQNVTEISDEALAAIAFGKSPDSGLTLHGERPIGHCVGDCS